MYSLEADNEKKYKCLNALDGLPCSKRKLRKLLSQDSLPLDCPPFDINIRSSAVLGHTCVRRAKRAPSTIRETCHVAVEPARRL